MLNRDKGAVGPAVADSMAVAPPGTAPAQASALPGTPETKGAGQPGQQKPVVNPPVGGDRTKGNTAPAGVAPAGVAAAPADGGGVVDAASKWMKVAMTSQMTASEARAAIAELMSMAPALSGEAQAKAYFVIGMSHYVLDENNSAEYCPMLRRADGKLTDKEAQSLLKNTLSENCNP